WRELAGEATTEPFLAAAFARAVSGGPEPVAPLSGRAQAVGVNDGAGRAGLRRQRRRGGLGDCRQRGDVRKGELSTELGDKRQDAERVHEGGGEALEQRGEGVARGGGHGRDGRERVIEGVEPGELDRHALLGERGEQAGAGGRVLEAAAQEHERGEAVVLRE